MSVLAEDVVRSLAGFRGEDAPVTSVYLDVDGRRHVRQADLEQQLEVLLRSARRRDQHPSVERDLARIVEHVRGGFDRSNTRGLAIFSCSAHDLWKVVPLPMPVRSRVVINHHPAVGQLEALLEETKALGVLLVDRQRARMYVWEMGELTERAEIVDELPRGYDVRGLKERGAVDKHVEALKVQHVRRALDLAFDTYQDRGFARLVVGGPDDVVAEALAAAHPYLKERMAGRVKLAPGASPEEIRAAALATEERLEREKEAALVDKLREAVASGRRGVAGIVPVLDALNEQRLSQLVVSDGYEERGWRCEPCGTLHARNAGCESCGATLEPIDDIVEEAVDVALARNVRVEVCIGNADLDVMGQIGGLLHY